MVCNILVIMFIKADKVCQHVLQWYMILHSLQMPPEINE